MKRILRNMKRQGLSVAELMIVIAVLGILAAIVVPQFQSYSTEAKKAVAKDALRMLRSAIELYTAQHSGIPPGYEDDDPTTVPTSASFANQLAANQDYLAKMPKNPFNNLQNIRTIGNNAIQADFAISTIEVSFSISSPIGQCSACRVFRKESQGLRTAWQALE